MAEWIPPTAAPIIITDEEIATFQASQQNLVLNPTESQFDSWIQAATAAKKNLKTWALEGLDELAVKTNPIQVLATPDDYTKKQA